MKLERLKKESLRQDSQKKKEKDKEDREKQKQLQLDRKEREKKRTQKGEKKRWCSQGTAMHHYLQCTT